MVPRQTHSDSTDSTQPDKTTPMNGSYLTVTLDFQRHRMSLEVEVESTFKSLPVSHLRGLYHNLPCLLPSATSFLLRFIFFETSGTKGKAVYSLYVLQDLREEVGGRCIPESLLHRGSAVIKGCFNLFQGEAVVFSTMY